MEDTVSPEERRAQVDEALDVLVPRYQELRDRLRDQDDGEPVLLDGVAIQVKADPLAHRELIDKAVDISIDHYGTMLDRLGGYEGDESEPK